MVRTTAAILRPPGEILADRPLRGADPPKYSGESARTDAQAADRPRGGAPLVPERAGHGVLLGLGGPTGVQASEPRVVAGRHVVPRRLRELVGAEVQAVGAPGLVVVAGLALPQLEQLAIGDDVV